MIRYIHTCRYVISGDDEYAGRGAYPVGYWQREPCWRRRCVRLLATFQGLDSEARYRRFFVGLVKLALLGGIALAVVDFVYELLWRS